MCFSNAKVCVCVFKKFQDNLNALKSSDVPSMDEILEQQSPEGRAKGGYEFIGVCRAMGCAPALGDAELGMGIVSTAPRLLWLLQC